MYMQIHLYIIPYMEICISCIIYIYISIHLLMIIDLHQSQVAQLPVPQEDHATLGHVIPPVTIGHPYNPYKVSSNMANLENGP